MRVEHFDILGSHSFPAQVDQRSRQEFEIGLRWGGPWLGSPSSRVHLQLPVVSGMEELAPHATPDRREQVEDGVRTVLARPLEEHHPCDGERLAEELAAIVPIPSLAPTQPFGDGQKAGEEGLDQKADDERITRGFARASS